MNLYEMIQPQFPYSTSRARNKSQHLHHAHPHPHHHHQYHSQHQQQYFGNGCCCTGNNLENSNVPGHSSNHVLMQNNHSARQWHNYHQAKDKGQ